MMKINLFRGFSNAELLLSNDTKQVKGGTADISQINGNAWGLKKDDPNFPGAVNFADIVDDDKRRERPGGIQTQ